MEVSGQVHAITSSVPEKMYLLPHEWEAGWNP